MKSLRLLLVLLSATFMVACNNDDEPELVAKVEDLSSNELTGTLWVAHPDNSNITPWCYFTPVSSIEFFGSKMCLINCSLDYYAEDPVIHFNSSEYNDETNTGRLNHFESNFDFTIIDNDLFITEIDGYGAPQTFRFTKDLNYEAPAKDCPLIGNWQGDVNNENIPESWNPKKFLKIIDNNRLLYYSNFVLDGGYKTILNYTFDGETLSFNKTANNHVSFTLKGNKLIGGDVTLTKK